MDIALSQQLQVGHQVVYTGQEVSASPHIPCHHFVFPSRTDKRTCRRVFCLYVVFYIRVLNAPGPVLLGADVHEDLGLVVDHVDCSVFLSLKTLSTDCRVDTWP